MSSLWEVVIAYFHLGGQNTGILFLLHLLARPCCHVSPNPGQYLQSVSEGLLGGCCERMTERNIISKLKFVMFLKTFVLWNISGYLHSEVWVNQLL